MALTKAGAGRVHCPGCGARYSGRRLGCPSCGDANPRLERMPTPRRSGLLGMAAAVVLGLAVTAAVYFLWR